MPCICYNTLQEEMVEIKTQKWSHFSTHRYFQGLQSNIRFYIFVRASLHNILRVWQVYKYVAKDKMKLK